MPPWNAHIRDLQKQLLGQVNDPFDGEYREAIQIDNGRIAHEPGMVVTAQNTSDVQKTIAFCVERNLRLTTKAGGHSAAGYCLNTGGVVLDLRRLNSIAFDSKTGMLKAGLGCRWRQIYDFLENNRSGRIPVGGGCPGVGLAGFLFGGGFSFLSRSYGLGSDHMKSLSIVTADSALRALKQDSSSNTDVDLFWACSGGGGGNFGVGVEVAIQTQTPPHETMLMGEISFPLYQLPEVLGFYNTWSQKLPPQMAVYGRIAMSPDARNGGERVWSLIFTPVYNGDFSDGVAILKPLIAIDPVRVDLHRMTIHEWEHYIGTRTTIAGRSAYIRSLVLPPLGLNEKAAHVIMKYFAVCPSSDTFMVWTQVGGAIQKRKASATAFPHRDAAFVPELKAIWDSSKPHEMRRNVEWAYDFYEEFAEASNATGAYVNYIDPLLTNWKEKYYRANYARLMKIKSTCDPNNVFSFQQSIGSGYEPSSTRNDNDLSTERKPINLFPLRETFHVSVDDEVSSKSEKEALK